MAVVTSAVESASGTDPRTCPTFTVKIKIFSKFSSSSPTSGSLRTITDEEITVFNVHSRSYSVGDEILIAQTIDETWVILDGQPSAFLLKSPVLGIPARSGTTAGKATCDLFYIDSTTDGIGNVVDGGGSNQTLEVYNVSGLAISGSVYIQAKRCGGVYIVDMEDCV